MRGERELIEIFKRFLNEKIKNMFCHRCMGNVSLLKNLREAKCTKRKCRQKKPISSEKLLYKCKIGLDKLLLIVNLLLSCLKNNLITSMAKVNKMTVLRIRKMVLLLLEKDFQKKNPIIGGKDVIVEIDESKFGKRKYNRGRKVEGVWIFGMVERTPERKIIVVPVEKRDSETLTSLIKKHVHPESIIYSDKWRGYSKLSEIGYKHYTVNHSRNFVDPITGIHTNTIEGNWSALKAMVPKRYRSKKYINLFLHIFMIKRNFGGELFDYLINLL